MPDPAFKRFGKYEIQAELGRGGFGRVYRAFDPTVGRLVAIKILMSEAASDLLTRFRNEATAAGNLRHENIVTIYEFGEDKGVPFIAMEYLEGEDLQQVLASGRSLTLLDKISIMTQAAAGLDCAHRHGVVHRDVKPANIRLLPDGTVKIMDFGIARLVRDSGAARLTRQGHVLGTLLYMAPEQVMGSDTDALCDVFAYGVTSYELLTGRHPFQGEDPRAVFYKITSEDPELIHHLAPDCPETLDHIVRRALQKDRELRYQTLRDLRVDVEPVLMELRRERGTALVGDAQRLVNDGEFERARALLNEAIDMDPGSQSGRQLRDAVQVELRRQLVRPRVEALVTKATQSLAEGNYADAVQTLDAALRLDPEDTALQARSREAQLQRENSRESSRLLAEARTDLAQGSLASAMHKASEAIALNPKSIDALSLADVVQAEIDKREWRHRLNEKLRQAREFLLIGSFDQALTVMNALDADQRNAPDALELMARLATKKAEHARQERLVHELGAARELLDQGQLTGSVQLLQRLRTEFPGEARVDGLMIHAQQEVAALERAQVIEDLKGRALACAEEKRFAEAVELVNSAAGKYPEDAGISSLRDAILHARTDWDLDNTLRECEGLAGQNRFEEALAAAREMVGKYPDEARFGELCQGIESERDRFHREQRVVVALESADELVNEGRPEQAAAGLEAALAEWPDERLRLALDRARDSAAAKQQTALMEQIACEVRSLLEQHEFDRAFQVLDGAPSEPVNTRLLEDALAAKAAWDKEELLKASREQAISSARREAHEWAGVHEFEHALEVVDGAAASWPGSEDIKDLRKEITIVRTDWLRDREIDAGDALLASGQQDNALALLRRAAAEYGESAALHHAISRVQEAVLAEQREQAITAKAIQAVVQEADGMAAREDSSAAIAALQRAIGEYGAIPELVAALARAREAEGNLTARKKRTAALEQAVERCAELIGAGSLAEAGRTLQNALRDFPGEPELAALQQNLKAEWDRKRRSEATRRAADNARALLDQGQPARAVQLLEAAAAQYPDDPVLQEALAGAWKAKGERQKAELVESVCHETRVYLDRKDFDQALRTVEVNLATLAGEPQLVKLRQTVIAAKQAGGELPKTAPSPPGRPPQFRKIAAAVIGGVLAIAAVLGAMRLMRQGAAAATSLTVETEPAGASVKIGDRSCMTPNCRMELPTGDYQVEARLPGYGAASEPVSIRKAEVARVRLVLAAMPASVTVTSNFASGHVYLDDKSVGVLADGQCTLNELAPGIHRLRIAGPDGEASLSFETAAARLPELNGPISASGARAMVVTSMGTTLRVACSGCEGALLLDGKPLVGKAIKTGDHEITSGDAQRVFFRSGDAPAIAINLSSIASTNGTLVVEANVDGASVLIDQRRLGRQTEGGRLMIALSPKDYTIEVQKPGYRASPERLAVKIRKGDQFRATFRLDPKPATVTLSGAQEGAAVLIDGKLAGTVRGGVFSTAVSSGAHTVGLTLEGFKPASTQSSLKPGETVRLDNAALRMERLPQPLPQQVVQQAPPPQPSAEEIEAGEWAAVRSSRDRARIQTFLQKHPNAAGRQEAQQLLAQLDWDTLDRKDRSALDKFAAQYRGSPLAQQASAEMARMDREAAAASAATATKIADDRNAADRAEIAKVLGVYGAAFERKDLKLLKTIWPNLPEAALAQAFRGKGEIRSQLRPIAPVELSGDRAAVRCTRVTEQNTQFGRQKPVEEPRTVRLRIEGAHWVISAID